MEAVWRGHVDIVRILVETGADVDAPDSKGDPVLLEGIWRGHIEVVKILVNAGADVNAADDGGDPGDSGSDLDGEISKW